MSYIPKLKPKVGGGLPGNPERTGGDYEIGDIQYSEDDLGYKWLLADGSAVLQTKYEKLFAKVGLQNTEGLLGPKLDDPVSLISFSANAVDITEDGGYVALGHPGVPRVTVYQLVNNVLNKIADPATIPTGTAQGVSWSSGGTYLAVGHQTTPFVSVYKRIGNSLTKIADPSVLPTSDVYGCSWSPDDVYLVTGNTSSPYIDIYKRAGDTLTKLPNPATLPNSLVYSSSWSSDGVYLTIGHSASPYITTYKRSGDTFTKLADPAILPTGAIRSSAWSEDDVYVALATNSSPYFNLYKRSGDVFTRLADTAGVVNVGYGVSWSGTTLAVVAAGADGLHLYERTGDTLTATLPDIVQGTANRSGTAFSGDGKYLATSSSTTPFIIVNYVPQYYDQDTEFALPLVEAPVTPRIKVL